MNLNTSATKIISKELKIIHINVNSIIRLARRYELLNFLNKNKPDIVLLNETKLNKKHKLLFEEYDFVRRDRVGSNRGGGTAILVKKDIKFKTITNTHIEKFKYLEACIIKIITNSNNCLYIISVYYPSGNNDQYLKKERNQLLNPLI